MDTQCFILGLACSIMCSPRVTARHLDQPGKLLQQQLGWMSSCLLSRDMRVLGPSPPPMPWDLPPGPQRPLRVPAGGVMPSGGQLFQHGILTKGTSASMWSRLSDGTQLSTLAQPVQTEEADSRDRFGLSACSTCFLPSRTTPPLNSHRIPLPSYQRFLTSGLTSVP